ncbi:MAG: glycosyltransferase family 2 protein [Trichodesmium sp. St19_bin1]|jgi:Glycosyltransferases, probably involved in cell wall biogenesis|nr:glycosyltransferase family 2 protein [Trichodesmium sp. St19_bin1]
MPEAFFLIILILQLPATTILLLRLIRGSTRQPPLKPEEPTPELLGKVTIVVPTLNEAERITPCLMGLSRQSYEVREIIVVDSDSTDDTQGLVKTTAKKDPRFRLITDDPLPPGWVGRPWALHTGFLASSPKSEWFLGVDADTQPDPGLAASLVKKAETEGYDLISLSPRFILKYPGELWLQPALLITLVYRFGPTGTGSQTPERVMANGQCFLCRRSVLSKMRGYVSAKGSFCDDVTLARNVAAEGFKVGFLDGSLVLPVRMYEGMVETWQEWGRSLDLKDASPTFQVGSDLWLLSVTQGLPLFVLLGYLLFGWPISISMSAKFLLFGLNLFLLLIRFALLLAIAPSYDFSKAQASWLFLLSPLADPLAVLRIFLSAIKTPIKWRGRVYGEKAVPRS